MVNKSASIIRIRRNRLTDCVDNIINLEDRTNTLRCKSDSAGGDEERLNHVLLQDVCDGSLSYIDPGSLLSLNTSPIIMMVMTRMTVFTRLTRMKNEKKNLINNEMMNTG